MPVRKFHLQKRGSSPTDEEAQTHIVDNFTHHCFSHTSQVLNILLFKEYKIHTPRFTEFHHSCIWRIKLQQAIWDLDTLI
jgi:hypothetical protein